MKRMLINATQEEELRMAMVDGQRLYDLNIELPSGERKKANIYKGQITRIEPSLEAAFVNYGGDRHGFLPLKEISSEYFVKDVASGNKPNIKDVLREGQDIVVQIDKEERGNKGAALTTFVSLAGRFIVLKPNKNRSGGVSRRIVGDDRDSARQSLREVDIPDGMSVILRTAGIDRSAEELDWDLQNQLAVWERIKAVVLDRPSPFLIYREDNAVVRALRDYLTNDIGEILIDDETQHNEALEFIEQVMPHNLKKLKLYTDSVPLFTRYQIESQIESAFAHSVTLPSGGSLVIDHTEALVAIDINSARATKGSDIEATAFNTNLEAADEVARQLRLRDLGGLVVIDFIDMGPQRNQREVENRLREAVKQDRARVQIGKITRFGLLEMSRQRLRPSLGESNYLTCPRCSGIGNIRSVESLALAILRIIGEEARKERTAKVVAQLPVEVATYLLNEKRDWVQNLESSNDTQVIMVANSALETPHYHVRRVRDDQTDLPENAGLSYTLAETPDIDELPEAMAEPKPVEAPAVEVVKPIAPAPARSQPEPEPTPGLFARIMSFFGGSSADDEDKSDSNKKQQSRPRGKTDGRRRGGQRGRRKPEGSRTGDSRGGQRAKKPAKARGKKVGGGERPDQRGDARPNDSAKPNVKEQDDARDAAEGGTRKAGSKRRSRGGRRRRKSSAPADGQQNEQGNQSGAAAADDSPSKHDDAAPPAAKKPRSPRKRAAKKSEPASAGNGAEPADKATAEPSSGSEPVIERSENAAPADNGKPQAAAGESAEQQHQPPEATAENAGSEMTAEQSGATPDKRPARKRSPRKGAQPAAASESPSPAKSEEAVAASDPDGTPDRAVQDSSPAARRPERTPADPESPPKAASGQEAQHSGKEPVEAAPAKEKARADKPAAAPAEKPAAESNGSQDSKPQGRLLPWEPAAAVPEAAEPPPEKAPADKLQDST